jgi:SAM-dependent methyltransferase
MFVTRESCPACGGAARTLYRCRFDEPPVSTFLATYYRRSFPLPAGEYRADQCVECGTIYQAEVADDALIAKMYGEWIGQSSSPGDNPAYSFDVGHPKLSRDGHEIVAAAAFVGVPLRQFVTLDYGMGWASWTRNAAGLGCKSYGFDISPARCEFAAKHGISVVLDGVSFHFINTEQVFEHVTEPATLFADLAARLMPGGVLKISVPSNRGLTATFDRLIGGQPAVTRDEIMPLQPLEHVNCFTLRGLELMASRHGLKAAAPTYLQRFAFLPGVSPRYPRTALKELVRPFYQWRNPANHYVWLRKPEVD